MELIKQFPPIDIEFAKLVCWGKENLSQREKDLIYIFENFQRAYATNQEILGGIEPRKFYRDQRDKVIECLKRQNIPFKI